MGSPCVATRLLLPISREPMQKRLAHGPVGDKGRSNPPLNAGRAVRSIHARVHKSRKAIRDWIA